ncbi:FlgB family protein [Plastorhodobacter daqingensis]|uniref:FlgB family protein n=1 Tax=Plastorhodobacter daqingensis TaxID=1387281 RepID=A0ABW2UH96_9RHOB
MFNQIEIMRMAHGMAAHAAIRHSAVAQNISNADTPGYRAVDIAPFADVWQGAGVAPRASRPGHLLSAQSTLQPEPRLARHGGVHEPNGNTVSLEQQMVKSAEIRHQHDMALSIYRSASSVLRKSLGR